MERFIQFSHSHISEKLLRYTQNCITAMSQRTFIKLLFLQCIVIYFLCVVQIIVYIFV